MTRKKRNTSGPRKPTSPKQKKNTSKHDRQANATMVLRHPVLRERSESTRSTNKNH